MENAWKGYNTSIFAYGQTGSGKSWSIIGYGANRGMTKKLGTAFILLILSLFEMDVLNSFVFNSGVVPMFCEELFNGIEQKKGGETTFEVKFSMLEIYNEIARDLLDANGGKKKSGLKIRQHPKKGFYGNFCLLNTILKFYRPVSKVSNNKNMKKYEFY